MTAFAAGIGIDSPLSDPGERRRLLPFALVMALGVWAAWLAQPAWPRWPEALVTAAILAGVLVLAAMLLPWARLPAWTEALPPVGFFIVFILLQEAAGGLTSGYSPLLVIPPVLWFALYGSHWQLVLSVLAVPLTFTLPAILLREAPTLSSDWFRPVLWLAVAALAAVSVHTLVHGARTRLADVDTLARIARGLTMGADTRTEVCRAAATLARADVVLLLEPDGAHLLRATATAGADFGTVRISTADETSGAARAIAEGRCLFVPDMAGNSQVSQRLVGASGAVSGHFEPVLSPRGAVGVLVLIFRTRIGALPPRIGHVIEALAADAAVAIDRADLVSRLQVSADTDSLTGVANRRSWNTRFVAEVARAARSDEPLSVILIDLDHFKVYNDTAGHPAGDTALVSFCDATLLLIRDVDVLARWGGDEFAIALPGCDRPQAQAVAERISAAAPDGLTCSVGIAQWAQGEQPDELFARADAALYGAKAAGRNQIQLARAGWREVAEPRSM